MSNPVLQAWVAELPWKQQSILFSGLRGPDQPNCPNIKIVNRWMRSVAQHNADPTKNYMAQTVLPTPIALCDELEFCVVHYVHHLADALAVIAYGHPDLGAAATAARYHYRIAEELFHFQPEDPDTFRLRHRDKPDGRDPQASVWSRQQEDAYHDYVDAAVAHTVRERAA
jgi:hypothetical protein